MTIYSEGTTNVSTAPTTVAGVGSCTRATESEADTLQASFRHQRTNT